MLIPSYKYHFEFSFRGFKVFVLKYWETIPWFSAVLENITETLLWRIDFSGPFTKFLTKKVDGLSILTNINKDYLCVLFA